MKDRYQDAMDGLHFTQDQKRAMVDGLLEAANAAPTRRTIRPIRRMALVAAAAALVLTVGAGASGILPPASEVFGDLFGGAPAQTQVVDQIGYPIGASATDNGVTITADAIIGDSYSYAILYSIRRDDGQPLADPEDLQPMVENYLPLLFTEWGADVGHLGGTHGSAHFFDADPSDNAIQYVEMMTADKPIRPGVAKVKFQDLRLDTGDGFVTLAEGTWQLKFDFAFEDAMVELPVGQDFTLNGMDATLDTVRISPLSYQVEYTVHSELQWDHESDGGRQSEHDREQTRKYFDTLPLSIQFKDGTTLDLVGSGGGISPKGGKTYCEKSALFEEILDLDQVESITVADITVPLA